LLTQRSACTMLNVRSRCQQWEDGRLILFFFTLELKDQKNLGRAKCAANPIRCMLCWAFLGFSGLTDLGMGRPLWSISGPWISNYACVGCSAVAVYSSSPF
jgi:hypothetical protein